MGIRHMKARSVKALMNAIALSVAASVGCGCSDFYTVATETQERSRVFVLVAEGFSSIERGSGIEAAYRMFTAPDMPGLCAVENPAQLLFSSVPSPVAGERMMYSGFEVIALSRAQRVIPRVPFLLSVEQVQPAVLDLTTTAAVSEFAGLRAIRSGSFLIKAEAACEMSEHLDARALVTVGRPGA